MKKICLIALVIFFSLFAFQKANAFDPQSGGSTVNAGVTQEATGSPTPTNIPTATLSPSPTQIPGATSTPTPTVNPSVTASKTPTPTLTSKDIYINISGLASPNASIVLTSNNVFLQSFVANSEGFFSLNQIKIDQANGSICFDTTDFKRVGNSYVCVPIPNQKENFKKDNLFLPPTMGLSARKILSSESAYAFGYSMPNSSITTFVSQNKQIKTTANDSGYYKVQVSNLPVGTYYLFATAVYEKQDSQKTDKPLELQSLTPGGYVVQEGKDVFAKYRLFFFLIIIAILILIIILLFSKKFRNKLKTTFHVGERDNLQSSIPVKKVGHLHHDWML